MKPYDPRLREAAEEFKALCKKYDCAGVVLFVSPTHSEFVNEIFPTWSVARPEGAGPGKYGIRFRSKKEDFPSREARHAATEATTHIFTSIIEWSRQLNGNMRGVIEQLSRHMKIGWSVWDKPDSVPGDGK